MHAGPRVSATGARRSTPPPARLPLAAAGLTLGVPPGGIPEPLISDSSREVAVFSERAGFVRLAMKHGTALLPAYIFGENQACAARRCGGEAFFCPGGSARPTPTDEANGPAGMCPVLCGARGQCQVCSGDPGSATRATSANRPSESDSWPAVLILFTSPTFRLSVRFSAQSPAQIQFWKRCEASNTYTLRLQ